PGAIFWMWIAGLLGMATKYAEALLAQVYRVKNENGEYSSGPMYYIERGIGKKWKPLGVAFAIFAAIAALGTGNGVQSNTIADVMSNSVHVTGLVMGLLLVILSGLMVFVGLKSISNLSGVFAPVMAILYIDSSLLIIFLNYDKIIPGFGLIFEY